VRIYLTIILLTILLKSNLTGQEGSKIDLNNVNVETERLPSIYLFGKEYTARNRDELLRGILNSQFYRPDLEIIINLQEFISRRAFKFIHKGPIEIFIDGKKLKNQNEYNNQSFFYQNNGESKILKLLNKVENVRIDSSLNGILKRRVLKKEITSTNEEIKKLMQSMNTKIEGDTIFVTSKSKERTLNKFYRLKYRQEKKFDDSKVIEINIVTN